MSTQNPNPTPREPDDPIPNPEPASPSLDEPDPGVFHHDPAKSSPKKRTCYIHPSVFDKD